MDEITVVCPRCDGQPYGIALVKFADREDCVQRPSVCRACAGEGRITEDRARVLAEREAAHGARVERRETIRDVATRLGVSPAEYSAWERGEDMTP